ncbi:hypothetical protein Pfo_015881 [Paulownia fortunei]|nr:hypothetical protein Pfo_015881 [Paulownia fortunei]
MPKSVKQAQDSVLNKETNIHVVILFSLTAARLNAPARMEPHRNLRLLFISLCLVISINAARSRLSPDVSPSPQPTSPVPSPSPSADPSLISDLLFPSISSSPSESISPSADSSSEYGEALELDVSTKLHSVNADFSTKLHSVSVDPEVKKICDDTDHPALCLATLLPLVKGKVDVESVLEVAVQASNEFAKQGLSLAKKLAEKPGTPPQLLSTLKDCKDSYDTAVDNFDKTIDAFTVRDIGTMRSMLSAVITFIGDCEDEFAELQTDSPLSGYAEKLTDMTSNCLAIVSQMN